MSATTARSTSVVDVVIVGAGPAGAVAATVLARAGVRVRLFERAKLPRHKLCGDTLNPGALALLRRLHMSSVADTRGLRIDGMRVTGEGGLSIEARYPSALEGRALSRAELDASLVAAAVEAGADVVDQTTVKGAIVESGTRGEEVRGVTVAGGTVPCEVRSAITIAADGRHSKLAFALGLASHPSRPRRWAVGAYFDGVHSVSSLGEMHIRRGHYIGLAPLPDGLTNLCIVRPSTDVERSLRNPAAALRAEIALEPELRDRMAGAQAVSAAHVLGPLAVDAAGVAPPPGLILAGDACGFVDPMTGDGLRFAIRGGELAAAAALRALEHGWDGVHEHLAAERDREFAAKWRFNRVLRALVGSPLGVWTATRSARVAPAVVRALITRASDCDLAMAMR